MYSIDLTLSSNSFGCNYKTTLLYMPVPYIMSCVSVFFFFFFCRLRLLLKQLDFGEMPSIEGLKTTISFAADVLNSIAKIGNAG